MLYAPEQDRGPSANLLAGIDAAVREGAQVICLPLGGYSSSDVERQAYVRALELGIAVVCAAGNAGTSTPIYPAAYPGCMGVAAVDTENRLAPFASFGKWVTVAAPGVDVPGPGGLGESRKWSGSSFACTIVTGVIALMLEQNPALDPESIRRILGRTGLPVLPGGATKKPSHLRLVNAAAALRAAIECASPLDGARRDGPAVARGLPAASRGLMRAAPKRRKKRDVRRFK